MDYRGGGAWPQRLQSAAQPQRALGVIEQALLPQSRSVRTIERGQL